LDELISTVKPKMSQTPDVTLLLIISVSVESKIMWTVTQIFFIQWLPINLYKFGTRFSFSFI